MTKIKITEKQAELLRSYRLNEAAKQNAKKNVLKITQEQYDRIFASGLIKESMNSVDKTFKTEFARHDIKNLKPVDENDYQQGSKFSISEPNPSLPQSVQEGSDDLKKETIELVKYLYRKSEDFSPYWEQHGLTYDDICDTLKAKKMIVTKNGKCELSKSLGTPEEAMQKLEAELRNLIGGEPSKGKSLETENYPLGAQDDPRAPYNQDPRLSRPTKPKSEPLKVVMYNKEIAILKGGDGSYYAFYYGNINDKDFAEYAEREEMYAGMADGEPDFEYGDFEVDENVIQAYVNDKLNILSKGEGLDAWESGVDLVKIDSALKQELVSMYDKNKQITNTLGSIQETSDDFEKKIEPTKQAFVKQPDYKAPDEDSIKRSLQDKRRAEIERRKKEANKPSGEIEEMTSAASSGQFTAPIGMTSREMPVDTNKMKVPVVYETLTTSGAGNYTYDANALPGINRDGSFKETKQTKAEKNTQWAGGAFVDFNDCTKLNNKPAGAGCSQGAVDNVVKLKKTSGNINAPSLSKGKQ